MAVAPATAPDRSRSLLVVTGTGALLGIGISASGNQEVGAWVSVGSLLGLLYAMHRFGRSGPDAPLRFAKLRRKKKRKKKSSSQD